MLVGRGERPFMTYHSEVSMDYGLLYTNVWTNGHGSADRKDIIESVYKLENITRCVPCVVVRVRMRKS